MKISVIGAGNVGATAAKVIADRNLAEELVLLDIDAGIARGKALDIAQSAPLADFDAQVSGTADYRDTAGSDLVIITAGMARKPGMSRNDLAHCNGKIVRSAVSEALARSPDAVILMVTNPLDVMAQLTLRETGLPKERVIGMAGLLDTSRFRLFAARELDVPPRDVEALVLGGHGDLMAPCLSLAAVRGRPLRELLSPEKLDELVRRTRDGGAEIVNLLKTGSAYYAPGESIAEMVEAMVRNHQKVLPCTAYLEGEYGISGVYCGVPCVLGKGGLTEIVELPLDEADVQSLRNSAAQVREHYESLLKTIDRE